MENTVDSDKDNESKTVYSAELDEDNAYKNIAATSRTTSESTDSNIQFLETAEVENEGLCKGAETLPSDSTHKIRKIQKEDSEQPENEAKNSGIKTDPAEIRKRLRYEEDKRFILESKEEKIQNELDRQRILRDIELDREERMSRQRHIETSQQKNTSKSISAVQARSHLRNQTHIQFRKPDGSAVTEVFNVNSVINDLRVYVVQNISLDFRQFDLAVAFPRHIFTAEENTKTLEELELTPTAVVLILPTANSSPVSYVYGSMSNTFWFFASPVVNLFQSICQGISRIVPDSLRFMFRTSLLIPALSRPIGNSEKDKNSRTASISNIM